MDNTIILHVEDDLDTAFFLKRALEKTQLPVDLRHLQDGEEAISYLDFASGKSPNHPLPTLILLDLKMPLKDGFEVLEWIKQKPELEGIPITILTSSDREEDIHRAKSLGVTSYIIKTVTFDNVVEKLTEFVKGKST